MCFISLVKPAYPSMTFWADRWNILEAAPAAFHAVPDFGLPGAVYIWRINNTIVQNGPDADYSIAYVCFEDLKNLSCEYTDGINSTTAGIEQGMTDGNYIIEFPYPAVNMVQTNPCMGTLVDFVAVTNADPGSIVDYDWSVKDQNGVILDIFPGEAETFSYVIGNNGWIVTCTINAISLCGPIVAYSREYSPAMEDGIPDVFPLITCSADHSPICPGGVNTLTITVDDPTGILLNTTYTFARNGVEILQTGPSNIYTTSSLTAFDTVQFGTYSNFTELCPPYGLGISGGWQRKIRVDPCNNEVSLVVSAFFDGYFMMSDPNKPWVSPLHGGIMETRLSNAEPAHYYNAVDHITIELHNSTTPFSLAATSIGIINIWGEVTVVFPAAIAGQSYFIVVRHPGSLETWSTNPVLFNAPQIRYDFTNSASTAFGNNLKEVAPSIFAIYNGDINGDGAIDINDVNAVANQASLHASGYVPEDLNGDLLVESADYSLAENNLALGVIVMRP